MTYDTLIRVLQFSVDKNGEKPLTNKWLLNLLKSADRQDEQDEYFDDMRGCEGDIF